ICGIGLATLELVHRERPSKARNLSLKKSFQWRRIEAQRLGHGLGAAKGSLAVDLLHRPQRSIAPGGTLSLQKWLRGIDEAFARGGGRQAFGRRMVPALERLRGR